MRAYHRQLNTPQRVLHAFGRVLLHAGIAFAAFAAPAAAQEVPTPNFWDRGPIVAPPSPPELQRLRFLTSVDYPPFNFLDARGRLAGFNVELARTICEELDLIEICQIEARPFEELLPALLAGEGDAIVAGLAVTAEARQTLAFTGSYFRYPARFVAPQGQALADALAEGLAGRRIGVVRETAHQAMLQSFFPDAVAVPFDDRAQMLAAIKDASVEAGFGDGVGLSFWLASEDAANCCAFVGGPYLSDEFLGEGLAIAVRSDDADLAAAFDYALSQIIAKGRFSELLLRSFPISAF